MAVEMPANAKYLKRIIYTTYYILYYALIFDIFMGDFFGVNLTTKLTKSLLEFVMFQNIRGKFLKKSLENIY